MQHFSMVMNGNWSSYSDHFLKYKNFGSVHYTPETNMILDVNYNKMWARKSIFYEYKWYQYTQDIVHSRH